MGVEVFFHWRCQSRIVSVGSNSGRGNLPLPKWFYLLFTPPDEPFERPPPEPALFIGMVLGAAEVSLRAVQAARAADTGSCVSGFRGLVARDAFQTAEPRRLQRRRRVACPQAWRTQTARLAKDPSRDRRRNTGGFCQRTECYVLHDHLMGSTKVTLGKDQQSVQQISSLSKMANRIWVLKLARHHPSS